MDAKVLREAMSAVASVVEGRVTAPILSNVCIKATRGGMLWLSGTDLDRWQHYTIGHGDALTIDIPGETTVPARMLRDLAAKLPKDAEVALEVIDTKDGRALQVKAGKVRFSLYTLDAEDWPSSVWPTTETFVAKVSGPELAGLLGTVAPAMSTDPTRHYLMGAYLEAVETASGGAGLRAVATDGGRLSMDEIECEGLEGMPSVIVPRVTVSRAIEMARAWDGPIQLSITAGFVSLTAGPRTLVSRTIEGTFPNYRCVIPSGEPRASVTLPRTDTIAALQLVDTVAPDGHMTALALDGQDLALSCSRSLDGMSGSTRVAVACAGAVGEALGANNRYVVSALEGLDADEVEARIYESGAPFVLTAPGRAVHVVMPMRI